jgi:hypothetical protein
MNVATIVILGLVGVFAAIDLGNIQRVISDDRIGSIVHPGAGVVLTTLAGFAGAVVATVGERSRGKTLPRHR